MSDPTSKSVPGNTEDAQTPDPSQTPTPANGPTFATPTEVEGQSSASNNAGNTPTGSPGSPSSALGSRTSNPRKDSLITPGPDVFWTMGTSPSTSSSAARRATSKSRNSLGAQSPSNANK